MRALARVSRIHREVAAGKFPSVAKLAEILEVTERTVKRDIAVLRDEMNAPLGFDRRKKGFYYTIEGWALPLKNLTEGDILSFFIAENALKMTGQNSQALQLKTSLAKIASLLPEQVSTDLSLLGDNVHFQNAPYLNADPETLRLIAGASLGQETIEFDYYSPHTREKTHRIADVYLLQNFAGDWYASSFDQGRRDYRDFHVGRMSNVKVTGKYFDRRDDWAAEDYMKRGFSMTRGGRMTTVSILFDAYQAQWIRERKHFHPEETREELRDGSLRLSFRIGEKALDAVARFCLTYAGHCRAEKPQKLRNIVREKLEKGLKMHE